MRSTRLILLGAGHAHLLLTERLDALRRAGIEPLLIAPRWFRYSGLATGVLSGALGEHANRIDVAAVAARRGLAFVAGEVTAIDRAARMVTLADGSEHGFDLLSLNIGSDVRVDPGIANLVPVKPLAGLAALRTRIEGSAVFPEVLIIGAGPSGTEVAAALAGLAERCGLAPRITLFGRPAGFGRQWRLLYASLERRGVCILAEHRIADAKPPPDTLIPATGLTAPRLIGAAGLATRGDGAAVSATLQSVVDPAIFAVGDCADYLPRVLPNQGVFAVRQTPVLARNLAAAARGLPLECYRPQRRWLAIMDLGDGTGFATWGGLQWRSRLMLRWKRHLDLAFIRRFG